MAQKLPNDIVLPDEDRALRLFSDVIEGYPTQTKLGVENDKVGEFRGFYHTKRTTGAVMYWRPRSSQFGGRAGGGHKGADIFAPPHSFPHETPIVAIGAGELTFRTDALVSNDIGNMAVLTLDKTYEGYRFRFLYGHLTRFHGLDHRRKKNGKYKKRRVNRGELIGYAGCSGNADTLKECSTENGEWRVSSGHVHLIAEVISLKTKTVTRVDPIKLLNWKLNFNNKDPERKLAYWKANLRPDAAQDPKPFTGKLKGISQRPVRRKAGRRRQLPRPFETLEFDHSRSIKRSLEAYKTLHLRSQKPDLAKGVAARERYFQAFDTVAEHIRQRFDPAVAELKAANTAQAFGGPLLRAILAAEFCLWHLMGGSAYSLLATNHDRGTLPASKYLVECGPGVAGRASLIGYDGAQSSLYRASYVFTNKDNTKRRVKVSSISFGAGSLTHATLSQDAEVALLESHKNASVFLSGLSVVAAEIGKTHNLAVIASKRLARGAIKVNDPARKKLLRRLVRARNAVLSASGPLNPSHAAHVSDKDMRALMSEVLKANITVYQAAYDYSLKKEGKKPIAPRLSALRLVDAKST